MNRSLKSSFAVTYLSLLMLSSGIFAQQTNDSSSTIPGKLHGTPARPKNFDPIPYEAPSSTSVSVDYGPPPQQSAPAPTSAPSVPLVAASASNPPPLNAAAPATPTSNVDPLFGKWQGTIHQNMSLRTDCHQATYDSTFKLTFQIDRDGNLKGQGSGHITNPTISKMPCSPNSLSRLDDWSAVYSPSDFPVTITGYVSGTRSLIWIHLKPPAPLKLQAHYTYRHDPPKDLHLDDDGEYFPREIPLQKGSSMIGAFSQSTHREAREGLGLDQPTDYIFPMDGGVSEDLLIDGSFSNSMPPWKKALLALLTALGAIGVIGAGIIMNPLSSDILTALGLGVGALEALKGVDLEGLASQAKLGGTALAALAEGTELARIYSASTAAGEPGLATAQRLLSSLAFDVAGFELGAQVMAIAIDSIAAGAALTGAPAALVGVTAVGAALTAGYGISKAMNAGKEWLTQRINASLK